MDQASETILGTETLTIELYSLMAQVASCRKYLRRTLFLREKRGHSKGFPGLMWDGMLCG